MNLRNILNDPEFGYYEKRLCVLLLISAIPNSLPLFQPLIIQYTPTHYCDVRSILENTSKQAENLEIDTSGNWTESLLSYLIPWERDDLGIEHRSSCKRYNVSSVPTQFGERPKQNLSDDFLTIPCKSIYYESNYTSATTEFGMVCEKSYLRPLLTSMMMVGNLLGGVMGGFFSDMYGRRKVFLAFTALQFVASIIISFSHNIVFYGIMMFISGIGVLINFMAAVLIGAEFVAPKQRAFTYFMIELGFSLGYVLMAPIMYLFKDWRWFLRFSGIIGIVYVPYLWLIDETPYWLIASGKVKEAEAVLKKVSKLNKKEERAVEEIREITLKVKEAGSSNSCKPCLSVVSNWKLLMRIIIVCASWTIVNSTYFAISLNTNSLSGSRVLNLLYAGLAEVAATVLFFLFAESRGRRNSYIGCMVACAVSVAITPLLALWNERIVVATTMFSKLVVTIAFNVIYIYTGELFPTKARQSIYGVASAFARMGGIISPFIIYAGEEGNTLAPSIGTAAAIFISAMSYIFMPETKERVLPQTINDAVNMTSGMNSKCCQLRKHSNNQKNNTIMIEAKNLCEDD